MPKPNHVTERVRAVRLIVPKAYRIADLPAVLGVGLTKVRELIDRGQLRAKRIDRCVVVLAVEVDRFLAELEEAA